MRNHEFACVLILTVLSMSSFIQAQTLTDGPVGSFDVSLQGLPEEAEFRMPSSHIRVEAREAFDVLQSTTQTTALLQRAMIRWNEDGTTETYQHKYIRVTRTIVPGRFVKRLKPGYFVHPDNGSIWRPMTDAEVEEERTRGMEAAVEQQTPPGAPGESGP